MGRFVGRRTRHGDSWGVVLGAIPATAAVLGAAIVRPSGTVLFSSMIALMILLLLAYTRDRTSNWAADAATVPDAIGRRDLNVSRAVGAAIIVVVTVGAAIVADRTSVLYVAPAVLCVYFVFSAFRAHRRHLAETARA